jgi:hypothetical protein
MGFQKAGVRLERARVRSIPQVLTLLEVKDTAFLIEGSGLKPSALQAASEFLQCQPAVTGQQPEFVLGLSGSRRHGLRLLSRGRGYGDSLAYVFELNLAAV